MLRLEPITSRPDFDQEQAAMGTAAAVGFGISGVLGFAAVAFPVPDTMDVRALAAVSLFGIVVAPLLYVARHRIPFWGYHLLVLAGIVAITLSILANGDPSQSNELFYLYVTCFVFYFFSWIEAATYALISLVAFGIASSSIADGRLEPTALLIFFGVSLMVGSAIRYVGGTQRSLHAKLEKQATTDSLTGLTNRRGLTQAVDAEMLRALRHGRSFSLLLGDLDRFKALNDRLGHMGGDMALERVAAVLTREQRGTDCVARVGGEEFAVLMPETDADRAHTAAERFRAAVAAAFADGPVELTISFGIATYPQDGKSWEQLLRSADAALYAAKEDGRDRVVSAVAVAG